MAHLAALNPLLLDPLRPSLFELVSASQLDALLGPSLRYVLARLASRYPRYLLRLVLNFDELYALLAAAIELRCLKAWNASFTESFYDLARRRVLAADHVVVAASAGSASTQLRVDQLSALRDKEIYASLFSLVGIPYLTEKFDRYYESLHARSLFRSQTRAQRFEETDSGAPSYKQKMSQILALAKRIKVRLESYFYSYYPSMRFSASAISLILSLFYLFGQSPYHSLSDFLIGIRFTRQQRPDSFIPNSSRSVTNTSTLSRSPLGKIKLAALRGTDAILGGMLPTAVFALKLLEWWHASDFPRQLAQSTRRRQREIQQAHLDDQSADVEESSRRIKYALDAPEVPLCVRDQIGNFDEVGELSSSEEDNFDSNSCRLCGTASINEPTAIETGRVFCYTCIYNYISRFSSSAEFVTCPITQQKLLSCHFDEASESWVPSGLRRLVV
ncbi:Pex12 amino terminal region-domain-containing protein [Lipomyces oligophaga]|uniref:Pex12 amino terminal region-domain-containing protein n=1 Tax=Lipomyces oligophaga TaxID=45792 RepID=UPI0034CEB42C